MTRNRWIAVGVVLVLCLAVIFVATKAHHVNTELAVGTGNEFFSRLQGRGVREASGLGKFTQQQSEVWTRLLANLDARHGAVTQFTLAGVQVVPIDDVGCALLQYQVSRGALASTENLVLCPTTQNSTFAIVGHELTRLDTQQNIAMGVKVQLSGVRLP